MSDEGDNAKEAIFLVKDLNTGAVFNAEKDAKSILKRYQIEDPHKLLNRGWWSGKAVPVQPPPPMFHLTDVNEDEEATASPCNKKIAQPVFDPQPSPARKICLSDEPVKLNLDKEAEITFVRISGTGTVRDAQGGLYTVYHLEVKGLKCHPPQWRVYRRYREFLALELELRKEEYRTPILPPRRLLGLLDQDFVGQRRVDLESWLYQLLESWRLIPFAPDPHTSPTVRAFLTDDANKPPFPMEVTDDGPSTAEVSPDPRWADSMPNNNSHLEKEKASGEAWESIGESVLSPTSGEEGGRRGVSLEDFELIRVIGKGSFGKVTLVRKKQSGKFYAMKVVNKAALVKTKQMEHMRTERKVLGLTNHPFIVSMHYTWTTSTKIYFVLDYCPGGELFFHLSRRKRLPEYMARFYIAEITLALEHLHVHGIVYRDLKPENIILDSEGHVKLADFGLAKTGISHPTSGANSLCGTPEYLAPEILNRKGHGTAVDWWGAGMVLYEMLTGLPPWYTTDRRQLFHRLCTEKLAFPSCVSVVAADLISGLLCRDPTRRLGAERDSAEVKEHKFFASVDWEALLEGRVKAPFNPCLQTGPTDTKNFDPQFTRMPLSFAGAHEAPLVQSR